MNANELFRRKIFGAPIRFFYPTNVIGLENLPDEPFVLAAGPHKTLKDSMIIPSFLQDYELHFLAKSSLWKIPVVGQFLTATGQIPVERNSERAADSVTPAVEDLNKGFNDMVFPEGTRYLKDTAVHRGKTGAVRISLASGRPLVPMALRGIQKSSRHVKRELVIGKPIYPRAMLATAENLLELRQQETILAKYLTTQLMNTIAELAVQRYVA